MDFLRIVRSSLGVFLSVFSSCLVFAAISIFGESVGRQDLAVECGTLSLTRGIVHKEASYRGKRGVGLVSHHRAVLPNIRPGVWQGSKSCLSGEQELLLGHPPPVSGGMETCSSMWGSPLQVWNTFLIPDLHGGCTWRWRGSVLCQWRRGVSHLSSSVRRVCSKLWTRLLATAVNYSVLSLPAKQMKPVTRPTCQWTLFP